MKIEIKNVKRSAFASQETHCFEAVVYVDGKRSFKAFNDGRGGANDYRPLDNSKQTSIDIDRQVRAINAELTKKSRWNDLDFVIGELVDKFTATKELKKVLKKVALVEDGKFYSLNQPGKRIVEDLEFQKRCKSSYPDAVFLNLLPFDDALELFLNPNPETDSETKPLVRK